MSRLLSSVVFLCLSLLWTINCENGVHLEVDYDTGKYHGSKESGDLRYTPGNNFALNCKKGARFVLKGFPQLRATRWEDYLKEDKRLRSPIDILRPLCKFSDPSDLSACRFVRNGVAPSVEGREEDPCTIYYNPRLYRAEEKDGKVKLEVNIDYLLHLSTSDSSGIEIFVIHFDKVHITHTTPVIDDPVTDDPVTDNIGLDDIVVLEHSAQSVDSAKSVNAEEGVSFKVKYEVGTYPNSQKRISLDKWDFKPDRKMEENPWVYASFRKDIQYLKFTCGPSKPVQLNCQNEMCLSIAAVPANGDSGTIVAYVFKDKNKERYHLVKPKKKMPKRHFCTLLVSPESYKVGFPKRFYKRHINILRIGSEEKRGFRLFHRSFEALEE